MFIKKKIKTLTELNNVSSKNKAYDSVVISLPVYKNDVIFPFNEKLTNKETQKTIEKILIQSEKILKEPGSLFIYGSPIQLIKAYEGIPKNLKFRYWIAIDMFDSIENDSNNHLKHNHIGILMLFKGNRLPYLDTKNTRIPHIACTACEKNLKDWGGKKHLMNIKGTGISDVWRDFFKVVSSKRDPIRKDITLDIINAQQPAFQFNEDEISTPVLERLLSLVGMPKTETIYLQIRKQLVSPLNKKTRQEVKIKTSKPIPSELTNKVILSDAIEIMEKWVKKYPEGIFDLVFADPPYNLDKDYKVYDDVLADKEYLEWSNRWLELCVRLTKPTGNILILNVPKWGLEYAKTLNQYAYLQNWIVWDALSTPKGKIMPAHYALLYYSKSPIGFIFNNHELVDSPEYCRRASCINSRKKPARSFLEEGKNKDNKISRSDIWWDIPRIKHKKDRDNHPCQLPISLMDRIVKIFSNEGNLVFDPFAGAGTTAISALKQDRKYLTIEIDPYYKNLTEKKLKEVQANGYLARKPVKNKVKSIYTKRWLELKVQEYAVKLQRKPTFDEFVNYYSLNTIEIEKLYLRPQDVLKAGRVGLLNHNH